MSYKKMPITERILQSKKILSLYPDRIPVIILKNDTCSDIPEIDKSNYLVPIDFKLGQLHHIIRKRIKLSPEVAIFLFVDNKKIYSVNELIKNIYEEHKSEDGFLYITYTGEKTFG